MGQTAIVENIADWPGHGYSPAVGSPALTWKGGLRETPETFKERLFHEHGLLLIQGPAALDWSRRKWGFLPRLENADLHGGFPPTMPRFELWLRAGVGVVGRPDWVFVKLHTHGAPERNADMLLGEPMRAFQHGLAAYATKHPWLLYYYVTARVMADLVHQAERGAEEPLFSESAFQTRSNSTTCQRRTER